MPATSAVWTTVTPNKTDHLTPGFTSKIIYNYQYRDGVEVATGQEIFSRIKSNGSNYKGINRLPANYFAGDDGRTFRISMYFLKPYDGAVINLIQQLYDVTNSTTYDFTLDFSGSISSDTGNALVKYEVYLTYYYAAGGPYYITTAVGSINYAEKAGGNNPRILQLNAANNIGATSPVFDIQIYNNGGTILPVGIIIEEIS